MCIQRGCGGDVHVSAVDARSASAAGRAWRAPERDGRDVRPPRGRCDWTHSVPMTRFQLQPYANHHGDSGVRAWSIVGDTLSVEFVDGAVYVYTVQTLGARVFEALCRTARAGRGLATTISRDVGARHAVRFDDRAHWARGMADAAADGASWPR